MQKKYFKCYFCKIGNSQVVPIEQKGKECRCCQAYNYFYNNQKEKNYHNNNYNKNSNYNRNKNHNNKYYKKGNNRPHYQNISNNNNNYRRNQESSNNGYFSRTNTNFYHNQNEINLHNNYNHIPNGPNVNRRNNNPIFPLDNDMLFCNILYYTNNSQNQISNNNFKEEKKDHNNNNNIKYAWLKKEKLTEKIMTEKKDINDCTICLEMLKKNDDINILKCGHIFHYKCIEKVVDHHLSRCPNCRCDLKTGEKQASKIQYIYPEPFTFSIFDISDNDNEELFEYDDEFY